MKPKATFSSHKHVPRAFARNHKQHGERLASKTGLDQVKTPRVVPRDCPDQHPHGATATAHVTSRLQVGGDKENEESPGKETPHSLRGCGNELGTRGDCGSVLLGHPSHCCAVERTSATLRAVPSQRQQPNRRFTWSAFLRGPGAGSRPLPARPGGPGPVLPTITYLFQTTISVLFFSDSGTENSALPSAVGTHPLARVPSSNLTLEPSG